MMDGEKVHPTPAFWFFHLTPPANAAHHLSPRLHLIIIQPWFPPSQAEWASELTSPNASLLNLSFIVEDCVLIGFGPLISSLHWFPHTSLLSKSSVSTY